MSGSVNPIVGVAQVLSIFVSASAAAAIAPHLVVVIAGIAGGIIGLMSWRRCSRREGCVYVLGFGLLAWLMAGGVAEFIGFKLGIEDKRIVTPIALIIGAVGHRWTGVLEWGVVLLKASIETAIARKRGNERGTE